MKELPNHMINEKLGWINDISRLADSPKSTSQLLRLLFEVSCTKMEMCAQRENLGDLNQE